MPAYVDIRKVFLQEAHIAGQVSLDRLPRFRDILVGEKACIESDLTFVINSQGQRQITGHVTAAGQLSCERCLEPVAVELDEPVRLILLDSEPEAATLDADWDPWLCSDYKLPLAELVEEQLILALPIVNLHADKDCIESLGYQQPQDSAKVSSGGGTRGEYGEYEEASENPFAVLKTLKLKKGKDEND